MSKAIVLIAEAGTPLDRFIEHYERLGWIAHGGDREGSLGVGDGWICTSQVYMHKGKLEDYPDIKIVACNQDDVLTVES